MITRRVKNLPFQNVAANSVASLELPLGETYHEIVLELGGTTFTHAHITNLRCKLNGKIFYEITGTYLDSIIDYHSQATAATNLVVSFLEPSAKTLGGMYSGGIGTRAGVQSFTMEVTIGGATAPTLESWSVLSAGEPLGMIHALAHHPVTFSAGGTFPIVLPHGPHASHLIKRLYMFHTNVTEVSVKKNGIIIYEEMDLAIAEYLTQRYGKTWQTGLFVVDFVDLLDMSSVINTKDAYDMRVDVTVSGSDTVDLYAEYVTRLENL